MRYFSKSNQKHKLYNREITLRMSVYCTVVLVGPQLLIEKCREPPVLDGIVPLHPLPHEAVLELSQHNIHLRIKQPSKYDFAD
jgi:hypothetical protein